MADLLDIAPSTASEAVWIGGHRISVRGVSIDTVASLIAKFPELRALVNGGWDEDIVPRVIQFCGRAVGPIIAAGCGHFGEEAYEQRAAQYVLEYQVKLLKAIIGLTFPNGIGSFAEDLTGLIGGTGGRAKPIKMRSKRSPSPLPDSSGADSPPTLQ
jgi:hypothetical protein